MWVDALKGDVKRCLAKQYRINDVGQQGVHETILYEMKSKPKLGLKRGRKLGDVETTG
jgi:hypothetical protein